jgi:hypothetical protein
MSGGHFNYQQHHMKDIAEFIQLAIDQNDSTKKDEYGHDVGNHYPKEIVSRLQKAATIISQAYEMAYVIDYLLSDDLGPETFLKRWEEKKLDTPLNQPQTNIDNLDLQGIEDQIEKSQWLNVHFRAFQLANLAWQKHIEANATLKATP